MARMIDLPALPRFTGKGLFGKILLKEGTFHPDESPKQTIFVLFDPPRKEHLGKPLSVLVTGDARLVRFDPPGVLKAGEQFSFVIEWLAKKQPFDDQMHLSAEYLVKLDVIAPARMMVAR